MTSFADAGDGNPFSEAAKCAVRHIEQKLGIFFFARAIGDWSRDALHDSRAASFQAPALIPLAPIFVCMDGWSGTGNDWATNIAMLVAVCLGACGGDNSQQARETLVSWNKSLELLEQQRAQRRVPEVYVRQMVRAAASALNQHRDRLPDDLVVHDIETRIQRLTSMSNTSSASRALPPEPEP